MTKFQNVNHLKINYTNLFRTILAPSAWLRVALNFTILKLFLDRRKPFFPAEIECFGDFENFGQ